MPFILDLKSPTTKKEFPFLWIGIMII